MCPSNNLKCTHSYELINNRFFYNNNIHLRYVCILAIELYTTEFDAIITRKAIVTVKFLISDSNIGTADAISQLYTTNAAFETVQMIKQAKTFNDHCSAST